MKDVFRERKMQVNTSPTKLEETRECYRQIVSVSPQYLGSEDGWERSRRQCLQTKKEEMPSDNEMTSKVED
jgi:hypothetical protein